MTFICYPKCTTCKKAEVFLKEKGVRYTLRDIKENNPSYDELKQWHEKSGLPLKKFFNTCGLLYKSMELKTKLPEMTEEQQYKLLSTDGMLVKRPILIGDDFVLVGFKAEQWAEKI
ncbi:MAG: arsenate reductase family protein [Eubacteriales bacterium]|nr:arsenate reductase family protein [Eubacteriales bacterium]